MDDPGTTTFMRLLRRCRHTWQAGLLLQVALAAAGGGLVVLALYGLLDFCLALGPTALRVVSAGLLTAGAVWLLLRLFVAGLRSPRETAARVDDLLADGRRGVLSAWELQRAPARQAGGSASELQDYLVGRSVAAAVERLRRLPWRSMFPGRLVARQARVLFLQVAVVVAVALLNPAATRVCLQRIAQPGRDIPPYSRYVFRLHPASLSVLYGGTLELAVGIEGAPVRSPVWLLTRYEGRTHRLACFQESERRFAQRLDKVVYPVECCFAVGRARSAWQPVTVRLQPQIASARFTVVPPAYSRLPPRQFAAGRASLSGLRKSQVTLQVTSNRPLLDGQATLRRAGGSAGDGRVIAGRRTAPQSVTFEWELTEAADVAVTVRDIQGTPSAEPLTLKQALTPDLPPHVVVTDPPAFILATPASRIPVLGYAEDDLGLQRLECARTVAGFRDRVRTVGPDKPTQRCDWQDTLDLRALGAEPGQTLELYLEARDTNPDLLGVAASPVVRVRVIAEEEYAQALRARTDVNDFLARYRAAQQALQQVRDALKELDEALAADPGQAARAQERLDAVKASAAAAQALYKHLAEDFQLYDLERNLAKQAEALLGQLDRNAAALAGQTPANPGALQQAVAQCRRNLEAPAAELQQVVQNAEEVAAVGRVMESVGAFQRLYLEQAELVRLLSRFQQEAAATELALLDALRQRQQAIREAFDQWRTDLLMHVSALPPDYGALRQSAEEFVHAFDTLGVLPAMERAVGAAQNRQGRSTWLAATEALEGLKQLLNQTKDGAMGGMCNGALRFSVPDPLRQTLAQMLAAIGQKAGGGPGGMGLAGLGQAGGDNDGYWMGGFSPLNMPLYGPERLQLGSNAGGLAEAGQAGGGARGRLTPERTEREQAQDTGAEALKGESRSRQQVPLQYRRAVERYFGGE